MDANSPGPDHYVAAAEFVLMLRSVGLRNTAVLRAMEQVPRVPFLERRHFAHADLDVSLPIACGQSILRPSDTARLIEALEVGPDHRVLQVGAGSGYAAAILGRLARQVVTIDRWRLLADESHARLRELGYGMVEVIFGDGLAGYAPRAPYDRILLTCAVETPPAALLAQLAPGGVLVAPVGPRPGAQVIERVTRGPEGPESACRAPISVAMAVAGVTRRL